MLKSGFFIFFFGFGLFSGKAQVVQNSKSPKVWLNMTQGQLDSAYTQSVWAPNAREVTTRYKINSEAARSRMKPALRFAYGTSKAESLDVFMAGKPGAPIHIFIHGGAWSSGTAADYSLLAELFVKNDINVVIPDFAWVQDVGGNLNEVAEQVKRAVKWTHDNAGKFGGDPGQIYLSGHSSGAHLAAVVLTTNWEADGFAPDMIKGGVICSGMFDLKPVRLSARSRYISFTDEMEDSLSPKRHIDMIRAPITLIYGTKESPEFQRQSKDFAIAATKAGYNVKLIVAENLNHFEILETMAKPDGVLWKAVTEQMEAQK